MSLAFSNLFFPESFLISFHAKLDPSTNVSHLNVRVQARTADGHGLYIHYNGVLKLDEAVGKVLSWAPDARTTNYGDHEWFSGPIFETSDPNLKWMETSLFVGQGHFVVEGKDEAVEYQIYKVVKLSTPSGSLALARVHSFVLALGQFPHSYQEKSCNLHIL